MSRDRDSDREPTVDVDERERPGPNPPKQTDSETSERPSRFGPRWAVVRRELRSLRSEKTIVLAIAIQLFIAAFSSFLVVGFVSMYDPDGLGGYEIDVAITGDDRADLEAAADEQGGLSTVYYDDSDAAYAAFDGGDVAAVLETTRTDHDRLVVDVTAPEEGIETTLLVAQLRDTLEAVEHAERAGNVDRLESTPVSVPNEGDASPYVAFTYTILIPLLLFLPAFISGSIVVDSLSEERERGTLELLRVTPLSLTDIVDAKLVATAALAPVQAVVWLVLLAVNGAAVARPGVLIALVAALSLLVVGFGTVVALLAPDRRQAQLLYSVAIVGALVVTTLLPEHPANTVAKFALGSSTATSWLLVGLYCLLAVGAVLAVRATIERIDPAEL
ncbi:ABC transporter permease [Natronobacterium gregoryi]|uniref:ABC transporter permease n=2 Tax=Natronobacterium gregoryi TaxID=44930 RepID=L0AKH6_NATGS|nr:ABC transporter permease [Natronobacterium gregoryi]AFZ73959.1 ABC-type Na+ efflux pump, permease component [Natronobacterium gregoryi SP2]ELY71705.1 ABC-2 type transporter [Natronobacterium gregoryi SP2]PLK19538.1 ABC transporter permease [Natronobacterium gregoryi SP2]SFJ47260.1 ABC-type Na+ efflux pump, permease component [Natronobacterium gregoryi]